MARPKAGCRPRLCSRKVPTYYMFYGELGTYCHGQEPGREDIRPATNAREVSRECSAKARDANTRDPMVIKIGESLLHLLHSRTQTIRVLISPGPPTDLLHWGKPTKVAYGGSQGNGKYFRRMPIRLLSSRRQATITCCAINVLWRERAVFRLSLQGPDWTLGRTMIAIWSKRCRTRPPRSSTSRGRPTSRSCCLT